MEKDCSKRYINPAKEQEKPMKNCSGRTILIILIFGCLHAASAALNISVPLFELLTRVYIDDGTVLLDTRGKMDINLHGGYKFGGSFRIGLESDKMGATAENLDPESNTEEIVRWLNNTPLLRFLSAEVLVRNILDTNLNMAYFTGAGPVFGNGALFNSLFGASGIGTEMKGFIYSDGSVIYDGIHQVNGTGLRIESSFGSDNFFSQIYLYQNAIMGDGIFSTEIRTLGSFSPVKIEAFAGMTFPVNDFGQYHGGFLFYYSPVDSASFLTQIGIPRFIPSEDSIGADLFFFLIEPALHFGDGSLILTLFWHPMYYGQFIREESPKAGYVDMNLNLKLGDPLVSLAGGGIETNITMDRNQLEEIRARVSPYLRIATDGALWDFRINTRIYPFDIESLIDFSIGVRAAF